MLPKVRATHRTRRSLTDAARMALIMLVLLASAATAHGDRGMQPPLAPSRRVALRRQAAAGKILLPAPRGLPRPLAVRGGGSLADTFTTRIAPTLGTVVANCMFLSGLPAVLGARRAGSLGDLNPVPWAFVLVNCLAWLHYSYLTCVSRPRSPLLSRPSAPL